MLTHEIRLKVQLDERHFLDNSALAVVALLWAGAGWIEN